MVINETSVSVTVRVIKFGLLVNQACESEYVVQISTHTHAHTHTQMGAISRRFHIQRVVVTRAATSSTHAPPTKESEQLIKATNFQVFNVCERELRAGTAGDMILPGFFILMKQ